MTTNNQYPNPSENNTPASTAKQTLLEVYHALNEKGYNPITQIVGYLLTEDPTYITNYSNARALIRRVDRDELLNEIVRYYFEHR
jgi:uncharacterized protein (UPF0297 family)